MNGCTTNHAPGERPCDPAALFLRSAASRARLAAAVWACLALAGLSAATACGSGQRGSDGASDPPPLEQVIAVDWALEEVADPAGAGEPRTRVSLALTDETGATQIELMGEFPGACSEGAGSGPGARAADLLALSCRHAGGGTELRVRRFGASLVLLRGQTGPDAGELSFDEAARVSIPAGAAVRARQ